jgi:hypothetical protein
VPSAGNEPDNCIAITSPSPPVQLALPPQKHAKTFSEATCFSSKAAALPKKRPIPMAALPSQLSPGQMEPFPPPVAAVSFALVTTTSSNSYIFMLKYCSSCKKT